MSIVFGRARLERVEKALATLEPVAREDVTALARAVRAVEALADGAILTTTVHNTARRLIMPDELIKTMEEELRNK